MVKMNHYKDILFENIPIGERFVLACDPSFPLYEEEFLKNSKKWAVNIKDGKLYCFEEERPCKLTPPLSFFLSTPTPSQMFQLKDSRKLLHFDKMDSDGILYFKDEEEKLFKNFSYETIYDMQKPYPHIIPEEEGLTNNDWVCFTTPQEGEWWVRVDSLVEIEEKQQKIQSQKRDAEAAKQKELLDKVFKEL